MIANKERYNEIKSFVDDFNRQLQEAEKRVMENMNTISKSDDSSETKIKKKKKNFTENIFKDPPSWKPNAYYGEYFEDFKRIQPKKFLNNWEIERIHLIPRSFTKSKDIKNKDWKHPTYMGSEFGDNKNNNLSDLGRKIISTFVKENTLQETIRKEKEDEFYRYKHSKPPLNINPWKTALHQMGSFEVYEIDKVHSFAESKPKKFLVTEPFKRPKRDGEYFGKLVHDINSEKEKMKKEKLEIKKKSEA